MNWITRIWGKGKNAGARHPTGKGGEAGHVAVVGVQPLSPVWLFATPWTTARQASLSITNSRSPHKPTSIKSVMPSSRLILCRPLLLLPPIFPSIKVFSNESAFMRWPKYWSFSFSLSPSNEHPGLISFWIEIQLKYNWNTIWNTNWNTIIIVL